MLHRRPLTPLALCALIAALLAPGCPRRSDRPVATARCATRAELCPPRPDPARARAAATDDTVPATKYLERKRTDRGWEYLVHRSIERELKVNANGGFKCIPGVGRNKPSFRPPNTALYLNIGSAISMWRHRFTTRVTKLSAPAGDGDDCARFKQHIGQPNPHWLRVTATRRVYEVYQHQYRDKCARYFREEVDATVAGLAEAFKGRGHYEIGFVDPALCGPRKGGEHPREKPQP